MAGAQESLGGQYPLRDAMLMYFLTTLTHFFHMGGYARFVWPVYIFTAAVLFGSIYLPHQAHKKLIKKLKSSKQ